MKEDAEGGAANTATEPKRTEAEVKCAYCHKPAPGWTAAEAAVGKRWVRGVLEYHCYGAYCWD